MAKWLFISLSICLATKLGWAGEIIEAHVTGVYCGIYGTANMCSIYFDKKSNSACSAEPQKMRMQLKINSDIAKAMLSVALAAHSQGKVVTAAGTGQCTIWADTEDLNVIFMLPRCSAIQTGDCTNQQ